MNIVNNGAEAVDRFEMERFDLISMGMQMPVMGGIEAAEAIRAREIEQVAQAGDDVDLPACNADFAVLKKEMTRLKPLLERLVRMRTIV